ncbi:MAG TPA: radical SAM protein [Geobacterales bacterium]|nr:radical SAM protein [Geobacterales bacterium]
MQVYRWWKKDIPEVKVKKAKSILHNFSTAELNENGLAINPYVGCQHRCLYCYATYEWVPDFYDEIYAKFNADKVLINELPIYGSKIPVLIGSATDSYQPVELRFRLTRKVIEILQRYGVPYYIFTKSTAVLRDLDLHKRYKDKCYIVWSLTTIDENVKRKIEPFAASAEKIFDAMKRMREADIICGLNVDPIMPGINDDKNMISMLIKKAKQANCSFISSGVLRLRDDIWERIKRFLISEKRESLIRTYEHLYFKEGKKIGYYYFPNERYSKDIIGFIEEECMKNGIPYGLPFIDIEIRSCYMESQRKLIEYA